MKLSQKALARITGVLYLVIILCGLLSGMAVRAELINIQNPLETIQNIIHNEMLFRVGFLLDLIMVISDVLISLTFFFLLYKVNKIVAITATIFRLVQATILGINLLNLFSPLLYLDSFKVANFNQQQQIASAVAHDLLAFEYGYLISGVFFAINCFGMGYLIIKSQIIPKFWGYSIVVAGSAYLINCIINFTIPSYSEYSQLLVLIFAVFAELGLCLYLITKGIKRVTL
jgi:hypothetical protein